LEGSILTSGSALEWLVEGLGLVHSVDELESLATSVDDNAGVYFVPALVGLGSPSWDSKARGLLIGLTRGVRKGHIARAALEALAFQVREVIDVMAPIPSDAQHLRVDGRPAMNGFLVQTLADVCGLPVERAVNYHVTLRGAAYLAGLSTGVWSSLTEISNLYVAYETFGPQRDRGHDYAKWQESVKRSYSWLT
jgi:glycerol kinase